MIEDHHSTRLDQDKVIADGLQASDGLIERAGIGSLATGWIEPGPALQ